MTGERATSSQRLDKAVRDFQETMNVSGLRPEENVCGNGQFFWSRRLVGALRTKAGALQALDHGTQPFVTLARSVLDLILARKPAVPAQLDELDRMAKRLLVNDKARAAMQALTAQPAGVAKDLKRSTPPSQLTPEEKSVASGLENELWKELNRSPSNTLPEIPARHLSLRTAWLLSRWDATACWNYVQWAAQRLRSRSGGQRHATNPFDRSLIGGSPPWGFSDRSVHDARVLGDVIYQRSVSTVVARMKVALREGQLLHIRVLSGRCIGSEKCAELKLEGRGLIRAPRPHEEHSLLVFSHNGIDTFVFHDADAQVSHTPQHGFGLLFYDAARGTLGTAASPSDLRVSDGDGLHRRGDKRYQVLRIRSA